MVGKIDKVRIDKWLWWARFFKTRSLAAKKISNGAVRVNSHRVLKPSAEITIDDVLTLKQEKLVRVIRVVSLGRKREKYDIAKQMYKDITDIKLDDSKINAKIFFIFLTLLISNKQPLHRNDFYYI